MYELIAELKKYSRHLVSNMFKSEDDLQQLIDKDNLFYNYVPNKVLNLWSYERDFARLYYFIADLSRYEIPEIRKVIVCDQFYQKIEEKEEAIINVFKKVGMIPYATYHKWLRVDTIEIGIEQEIADEEITIVLGMVEGFFELLQKYFDVYTDLIPEEESKERYFSDKICFSALHAKTRELVGGLVITKRGSVQTEEFLFVNSFMRGKGIARKLYHYYYQQNNNKKVKYVAWINDNNSSCIKLLCSMGYQKESICKITMKKEY